MINLHVKKLGDLWCATALKNGKIIVTDFASSEESALKSLLKELPHNSIFREAEEANVLSERILKTIKAVYDGEDVSLNFQFAMSKLSDYAQRVLKTLLLIPTGYVTTYGALAKAAGGSPRSVGRVMATNPFAPLIPCHRVVATDMTLGGYGGGLKLKWEILQRESRNYGKIIEVVVYGKQLKLFPVRMLKPSKY